VIHVPEIRAFAPHEWRIYRDLRLRALSDSPDAFVRTFAEEPCYNLTDGKVHLVIRPWDMVAYRGLMAGLDHFGFKVDDLERVKKESDALTASTPASAPRKIAIGRDGEVRQKNLEDCKLCGHALSDPDGVLLDLTE
jgi:hypothetical protein